MKAGLGAMAIAKPLVFKNLAGGKGLESGLRQIYHQSLRGNRQYFQDLRRSIDAIPQRLWDLVEDVRFKNKKPGVLGQYIQARSDAGAKIDIASEYGLGTPKRFDPTEYSYMPGTVVHEGVHHAAISLLAQEAKGNLDNFIGDPNKAARVRGFLRGYFPKEEIARVKKLGYVPVDTTAKYPIPGKFETEATPKRLHEGLAEGTKGAVFESVAPASGQGLKDYFRTPYMEEQGRKLEEVLTDLAVGDKPLERGKAAVRRIKGGRRRGWIEGKKIGEESRGTRKRVLPYEPSGRKTTRRGPSGYKVFMEKGNLINTTDEAKFNANMFKKYLEGMLTKEELAKWIPEEQIDNLVRQIGGKK